jgi:hypothetical protein
MVSNIDSTKLMAMVVLPSNNYEKIGRPGSPSGTKAADLLNPELPISI